MGAAFVLPAFFERGGALFGGFFFFNFCNFPADNIRV